MKEHYFAGLTKKSKSMADEAGRRIDELVEARAHNVSPPANAIAWANGTKGKLKANLIKWGLAKSSDTMHSTSQSNLLESYLTSYVNERSDVKESTRVNYKQTVRLLVTYFGPGKELGSITEADAERFQREMKQKGLAEASISRHTKRAKTMFAFAVKDRLLAKSPFISIKGGDESSKNKRTISPEVSIKVLEACPTAEWKLIFSLARYGGLRCPSEIQVLKWTDIKWDAQKFRIDSPKTGERYCPLFPEIRKAFVECKANAPEGEPRCIPWLTSTSNLRTQFARIISKAGISQWPRLFVNLRSTRRTELEDKFPSHVINKWLGQSSKVAEKHYLQVTEEHFEQGASFGSHPGTHSPSGPVAVPVRHKTTEPSEMLGPDAYEWLWLTSLVTPMGFEPMLPP